MELDELEKLNELESKIKEKQELIAKILNPNDIDTKNKSMMKAITKEVHTERGRLLKIFKNNKSELDSLSDKYDMYINIYDILDREENNNYTKADKINDIKNAVMKSEYTPFEQSILEVINGNLDNLDAMKSKMDELDQNGGIKKLISIKESYREELKNHRENIDYRYSNEFIHKKATIPTIVTVLPKAVALAVKKVGVCINERKEAKTNKEKFNKLGKIFKAIGQVAATPVIYTGKFIIDHWYLLLLLLLSLPGLLPFLKKGKEKAKDEDLTEQGQEQEVRVTEREPKTVTAGDKVKEPSLEGVPQGVPSPLPTMLPTKPVPVIPKPQPNITNSPIMTARPAGASPVQGVNVGTNPFPTMLPTKPVPLVPKPLPQITESPALTGRPVPASPAPDAKPAIDVTTDPRFNGTARPAEVGAKAAETAPAMSEQERQAVDELNGRFIDTLENDYNYVIGTRHPDTLVVHSAEEYVKAVRAVNPNANITVENARFFYERQNATPIRGIEKPVVWPEADANVHYFENEQALANYIAEGGDSNLNAFYNHFIEYGGNIGLFNMLGEAFNRSNYAEYMEKLGISGTGALMLFCLYEVGKYALAAPSAGATLALP